jgi:hypothetical protein
MFISRKKNKTPPRIADPKLAEKMRKLTSMYPPGNRRRDPLFFPNNKVKSNYARRTLAAKKIQMFVRLLKNIEKAKQTSPHTRTINNPLWVKFFNYQMKRANEKNRLNNSYKARNSHA